MGRLFPDVVVVVLDSPEEAGFLTVVVVELVCGRLAQGTMFGPGPLVGMKGRRITGFVVVDEANGNFVVVVNLRI